MTVDATPIYQVFTVTREAAGEVYPVTFPYISPEYVKCYYAVDKEQTQLVFGRDYTVNSETNELTVVGSVPVDAKLVIYRVTDLTQEIDWVDGQAVYTPDIEQADDKAMHILQELAEQTNRSVKITREQEASGTNPEYRWEEIEQARNEVLAAKEATESAKIDAEAAKDEAEIARNETLDARDTALETISNAQEGAQEAIYEGKQAAIADIGTAKDNALTDMADIKDEHIASINTAKNEALEAIDTDKQGALYTIDSYTNMAISSVGSSGAEWVQKAKAEADRSGSEADRAKSEADRAQNMANIGPATTEKAGLMKPGNNMTVRADGTVDVEVPEPPAPYILPAATADVLGGIKVGDGLEIEADGKLKAKAQPVDIATQNKAGLVKPDSNMTVDATGTLTDKREVLYFEEEPEEGLPTTGIKEGAIAIIDDGEGGLPSGGGGSGVPDIADIAAMVADILKDSGITPDAQLPELTEEHVVGTLSSKPVYERIAICKTPSVINTPMDVYDCSSWSIDKLINITGCIQYYAASVPINSYRDGNIMPIDTHYQTSEKTIRCHIGAQFFANEDMFVTMQYTKTTD